MDCMTDKELWADAYKRLGVIRSVQICDSESELDILSRIQNDVLYRFNDVLS